MLAELREGEVQVLCNVDVASEGFDEPRVEYALPLRWTDEWRRGWRKGAGGGGEGGREMRRREGWRDGWMRWQS
jgi:hypothetical protein